MPLLLAVWLQVLKDIVMDLCFIHEALNTMLLLNDNKIKRFGSIFLEFSMKL